MELAGFGHQQTGSRGYPHDHYSLLSALNCKGYRLASCHLAKKKLASSWVSSHLYLAAAPAWGHIWSLAYFSLGCDPDSPGLVFLEPHLYWLARQKACEGEASPTRMFPQISSSPGTAQSPTHRPTHLPAGRTECRHKDFSPWLSAPRTGPGTQQSPDLGEGRTFGIWSQRVLEGMKLRDSHLLSKLSF